MSVVSPLLELRWHKQNAASQYLDMVTKFGSSEIILLNPTASYNLVENLTNYRLYLRSYLNTLVLMCANAKIM